MTVLPHDRPDEFPYLVAELPEPLYAHARRFGEELDGARSVAVAFSGGVDSTVTVALAARALGRDRVTAVLGVSPSLSDLERRQAHVTSRSLGVQLREVATHELEDPDYVRNRGNRCYFCKHELYTRAFAEAVSALGCDAFLNGDTADDHRGGHRPGRRAAEELGVRSPLAGAGIGKSAVRALARDLGLAVWDKPSAPCLASRVPVDTPVTRDRLAQIERAEASLRSLGLRQLRVRHFGATARVELGEVELGRIEAPGIRAQVMQRVTEAGYLRVELAAAPLQRS